MKTKISRILGVGVTLSLLASLLIGALPASAAVSSATVALDDDEISATGVEYDMVFSITAALTGGADTVDIEFPANFDITGITDSGADADVTAAATSGIGTTAWGPSNCASSDAGQVLSVTIPSNTGVGATIQIIVDGVTNGPSPGDYVLQISTSAAGDTTQVDSQTFTLVVPYVPPAPGIVYIYNDADILMDTETGPTAIATAIGTAQEDWLLVIGPGTYTENPNTDEDGQRFRAEVPGTAIIQGTFTIDEDGALLEDLNIEGGIAVTATGAAGADITDCSLKYRTGGPVDLLTVANGATGVDVVGCTFDVSATGAANGINTAESLDVTGCDFTSGAGNDAIQITPPGAETLDVDSCTFAGPGNGLDLDANSDTLVGGCGFDGLNTAVTMDGDTLDVQDSTFTGCGDATATSLNGVFDINAVVDAQGVTIVNNTFTTNEHALMMIGANADDCFFKFNTCDNAVGFDNNDANTLDATNCWWGSAAGPTVTNDPPVDVDPWLPAPITGAYVVTGVAAGTNVNGAATVGVEVISTGTMACVGLGNYAENPVPGQPYLADVVRWFEINVVGLGAATDDITISLHGITNTAAAAYAWSTYMDQWVQIGNVIVDLFTGEVRFTLDENTRPSNANLNELVFALTEPATAPLGAPTQASLSPAQAAEGVSNTLTAFTWGAVAGATSYNFELAPYLDVADPFLPAFLVFEANVPTNGIILVNEELNYLSTYAWRVQAQRAEGDVGAWVTSFFVTMAEPEETPEPIEIVIPEPTPTPQITIDVPEWQEIQVIPDYLLWVVVGVGAVLVIAVIVLIVRTRRVA